MSGLQGFKWLVHWFAARCALRLELNEGTCAVLIHLQHNFRQSVCVRSENQISSIASQPTKWISIMLRRWSQGWTKNREIQVAHYFVVHLLYLTRPCCYSRGVLRPMETESNRNAPVSSAMFMCVSPACNSSGMDFYDIWFWGLSLKSVNACSVREDRTRTVGNYLQDLHALLRAEVADAESYRKQYG